MVLDSEEDRKLLTTIIQQFPMQGPFVKIARATTDLTRILDKVSKAEIIESKETGDKSGGE